MGYYQNITTTLREMARRYAQKNRRCGYPIGNAKYRRLLKLAEYQNMALQGTRKYRPPAGHNDSQKIAEKVDD